MTIPNGVDTGGVFHRVRNERLVTLNALGLQGDAPVLTWVGRLFQERRPEAFLDTVAQVANKLPITGLIVGAGPLLERIDRANKRGGSAGLDVRRRGFSGPDVINRWPSVRGAGGDGLWVPRCGHGPGGAANVVRAWRLRLPRRGR